MKKIIKRIIAGSLAVACTVTAGVAAIATNGFGLGDKIAQVEQYDHNKQTVFGNFFGNGITLTASAAESTTGTPVFDSVVSDLGDISSNNTMGTNNMPFVYQNLTLFENSTVTKIGVPVKTVSDYTSACTFTVCVASYDDPLTAFTKVAEYKLTIPANTFTSNTVGEWHYFDTNITVGDNQTLVFCNSADTVQSVSNQAGFSKYAIYKQAFSGVNTAQSNIYFDVYTSPASDSSTPATGVTRLTASFTPANASNQNVDWSIAWANASSTWASGKTVTDYVTITPTSDGAVTADIECLQAFGEQINVTVTSRGYDLSASCTVDYASRITNFEYCCLNDTNNGLGDDDFYAGDYNTTSSIAEWNVPLYQEFGIYTPTITKSTYTLEDEFTFSAVITVNEDVLETISTATGYTFTINPTYANGIECALEATEMTANTYFSGEVEAFTELVYYDGKPFNDTESAFAAFKTYLYDNWQASASSKITPFHLTMKFTGTYSTYTIEQEVCFQLSVLNTVATAVALNASNIVL